MQGLYAAWCVLRASEHVRKTITCDDMRVDYACSRMGWVVFRVILCKYLFLKNC